MSMFKYGIACALDNPSMAAPITLRGDMEYLASTVKRMGMTGIELQMKDPQNFDWKQMRQIADQAGLEFTAIATGREYVENGLCLISDDPANRKAAVERLKVHIDMAEVLGAMVIVGSMRASVKDFSKFDYYMDILLAEKLELADYAAKKKVDLLIENILESTSNYLNTMRQVMDYVVKMNRDNVYVHLDTYSMLMEDNDIVGAVEYCAPKLKYVHFSDSARLYPGGGNVDFKTFMKVLKKVGYTDYVVTECKPIPDAETCAQNGIDYIRALEECIRIEQFLTR